METPKPVVELSHVLLNIIDGGSQFFAWSGDPTGVPEDAIWVSLGTAESNWIEVHPVENDDPNLLSKQPNADAKSVQRGL